MVIFYFFWAVSLFRGEAAPTVLNAPTLQVKLVVTGEITKKNKGDYALLDQTVFDTFSFHELHKPRVLEGETEKKYRGYALEEIFSFLGVNGTKIEIFSKTGEKLILPLKDLLALHPLLVTHVNEALIKAAAAPFILVFDTVVSPKAGEKLPPLEQRNMVGVYKMVFLP